MTETNSGWVFVLQGHILGHTGILNDLFRTFTLQLAQIRRMFLEERRITSAQTSEPRFSHPGKYTTRGY